MMIMVMVLSTQFSMKHRPAEVLAGKTYFGKNVFYVGRYLDLKEQVRETKVLSPGLVAQVQVRVLELYGRRGMGEQEPVHLWV